MSVEREVKHTSKNGYPNAVFSIHTNSETKDNKSAYNGLRADHQTQKIEEKRYASQNSNFAFCNYFEKRLSLFYYHYAKFVVKHPRKIIIVPLLFIAVFFAFSTPKQQLNDPAYSYTPQKAPSLTEKAIIEQHWPLLDGNYNPGKTLTQQRQCQVLVHTNGDDNILERDYISEVIRLNQYIINRIPVFYKGNLYTYQDLCMHSGPDRCWDNPQIAVLAVMYENYRENLTWPIVTLGDVPTYLASSVGNVTTRNNSHGQPVIDIAQALLLIYHLQFTPENVSYISGLWEEEFEIAMANFRSDYVSITYMDSQSLPKELDKNGQYLLPKFAITFLVLVLFTIICSMSTIPGTSYICWVESKPQIALLGVVTSGFAVISSMGLLNLCHERYDGVVSVMPFLVVSIGVNNQFILINAWRLTSRLKTVEERLPEMLSESAVSLTITAATDWLSFGIGSFTNVPALELFCEYAAVAFVFNFIYQLTFLLGLIVIAGKMEAKNMHCIIFVKTVPYSEYENTSWLKRFLMMGSEPNSSKGEPPWINKFFENWYGPILVNPFVKALGFLVLAVYVGFAILGCIHLKQGLQPEHLLVSDSYLVPHYAANWKYLSSGSEVQIVVNNVSNLSAAENQQEAFDIVKSFINPRFTLGQEAAQFFLPLYLKYLNESQELTDAIQNNSHSFLQILKEKWLPLKINEQWRDSIVWQSSNLSDQLQLVAYRFSIGLSGFANGDTTEQMHTVNFMRNAAARFPARNITTFNYNWFFCDQYISVVPNTIQDAYLSIGCMCAMALILIPHPLCAIWIAIAIVSIELGIVGYLSLWGLHLDIISMVSITMSMGFAVDYSAHITYGYVISDKKDPTARISQAISQVGWPIIQGAISTVIGISVLSQIDSYMVRTFFTCTLIIILVGTLHGLIFLPIWLHTFVRGVCINFGCKKVGEKSDEISYNTRNGNIVSVSKIDKLSQRKLSKGSRIREKITSLIKIH